MKARRAEWQAKAFHALARWAKRARNDFTIEQARDKVAQRIPAPDDLRWWGTVTRSALAQGVIQRTPATRPARSSHYAEKPVYRGAR